MADKPKSRRDAITASEAEPWLTIDFVLNRLEALHWRLVPYLVLPILRELAEVGQLRARGRCCAEAGLPYGDKVEIAVDEWPGLEFTPALLFHPHGGIVCDRTTKHRAIYAEVELSGADLTQLWRSGALQPPGSAPPQPPAGNAGDDSLANALRHLNKSAKFRWWLDRLSPEELRLGEHKLATRYLDLGGSGDHGYLRQVFRAWLRSQTA